MGETGIDKTSGRGLNGPVFCLEPRVREKWTDFRKVLNYYELLLRLAEKHAIIGLYFRSLVKNRCNLF